MNLVTEVHIPQAGGPAIGVVSDLESNTHVVLHHGGQRWEVMAITRTGHQEFRTAPVNARHAWTVIPLHIEGELNRRLTAARTRATVSGTYATSSYEPLGQIVDVEA